MLCVWVCVHNFNLPNDFFTIPAGCSWLLSSNEKSDLLIPVCFLMVTAGSVLGAVLLLWCLTGDDDAQSESVSSPDIQWVWLADISLLENSLIECCSHEFDSESLFSLLITLPSPRNRSLSLHEIWEHHNKPLRLLYM